MKKLIIIAIAAAALAAITTGCATKSRTFDAKGMYVSESGQLAVGYIHVDAIPEGVDSAVIHYTEDTALLSPSTKTHDIDIILTGTNSVGSASGIVKSICSAFVQVAPSIAKTNAEVAAKGATSPIDLAKANSGNKKAVALAKTAAKEVMAAANEVKATATTSDAVAAATTETAAAACTDGSCTTGACTDGTCSP